MTYPECCWVIVFPYSSDANKKQGPRSKLCFSVSLQHQEGESCKADTQ